MRCFSLRMENCIFSFSFTHRLFLGFGSLLHPLGDVGQNGGVRVRVRVRSEGGSSHTSAANRQSRKQKGRKEKRKEKKIRDTQTKVASFFCLFFFPKEKKNQLIRCLISFSILTYRIFEDMQTCVFTGGRSLKAWYAFTLKVVHTHTYTVQTLPKQRP